MRAEPELRILHTESSTGWGGQEIRILTEITGMVARGHSVTLICPVNAEIAPAAKRLGIDLATLPIEKKRPAALRAIRRWLSRRSNQYDIINTHSSTDSWLVAVASTTLRHCPPIVRTRHVSTAVNRSRFTRWLYQRATSHIVTTGETLRRRLHDVNGYRLDTITSIPTGIDLNNFRPLDRALCRTTLGLSTNANYVGIVATLRTWKGHIYLFEAMAQLPPELNDWLLLVIGDGPNEANLRAKVTALGLSDRIRFVGRQNNIPTWLNALDIFALPSYGDEGVPQSIIQAMACGLPVISTPIGSITEAVVHGVTGIVVPPKGSTSLANAIASLARQPELRTEIGRCGVLRAREHFDIERMLDKMETVFANVIRTSR